MKKVTPTTAKYGKQIQVFFTKDSAYAFAAKLATRWPGTVFTVRYNPKQGDARYHPGKGVYGVEESGLDFSDWGNFVGTFVLHVKEEAE